MDYREYSQQVQEWIRLVMENRGVHADKTLENCESIKQYAAQVNDKKLLGFAYYYAAETYYVLNSIEHLFHNMTRAIGYLEQTRQWGLSARAYNLLAITSFNRGNAPFAMDYYLNGLFYCSKYHLYEEGCMINLNIGTLYLSVGEYALAQKYLKDSYQMLLEQKECRNYNSYKTSIYISMGKCCIRLGKIDKAREYMEKIEQECYLYMEETDELFFLIYQANLYHAEEKFHQRDICIERIRKHTLDQFAVMDVFDELYEYSKMLFDIGRYQEFLNMVKVLETPVKHANLINLQRKLISLKLEYYKLMQEREKYLMEAGIYYELSSIMEKETSYMISAMLNVRQTLDAETKRRIEAEQEKQILMQKSKTDALTGLYNRLHLNTYTREALLRAKEQKSCFAVEMLDVDYFKQYNDNYGHQAGDVCLKQAADRLKMLEKHDGITAFRYGGDEFAVVFEGYTRLQVKTFMQELKDSILELQIEHQFSQVCEVVTISQGAWADVPQVDDSVEGYLHFADDMLYQVKKKGRNDLLAGGLYE